MGQRGGGSASIAGFPFLSLSSHLPRLQIGEALWTFVVSCGQKLLPIFHSSLNPLVIAPLSFRWAHGLSVDILQPRLQLRVTVWLSSSQLKCASSIFF